MRRLRARAWMAVGLVGAAALTAGVVATPRLRVTSGVAGDAGVDARTEMLDLLALGRTQVYRAGYVGDAPERRARKENLRIDVWRKAPMYRIDTTVRTDKLTTYTTDVLGAAGTIRSCTKSGTAAWACVTTAPRPGEDGLDSLLERVARDSAGQQVVAESRTVANRSARCFTIVDESGGHTALCLMSTGIPLSLVAGDVKITLQDLSQGVGDKDFVAPA